MQYGESDAGAVGSQGSDGRVARPHSFLDERPVARILADQMPFLVIHQEGRRGRPGLPRAPPSCPAVNWQPLTRFSARLSPRPQLVTTVPAFGAADSVKRGLPTGV